MSEDDEQTADGKPSENESVVGGAIATIDAIAPTGWRVKLARVAAQLIAGTEKGSLIYGQMRERMDTVDGRSVVSKALANAVAEQAVNDPEIMERAKARYLATAIQGQENIEAVIDGATQYLPMLPAPNGSDNETNTESLDQENQESPSKPSSDDGPLNADWAATFSGIAENASSEELRDRLSRILAGELTSPGTYRRATVRAISELEQVDLLAMQAALPYVLGNSLYPTQADPRLPTVNELLTLTDPGLILDANAMLSRVSHPATSDAQPHYFGGEDWGLIIFMNSGQKFSIPFVPLTRTGIAVVDLFGKPDERVILRRIASELPKTICSKIFLGRNTKPGTIEEPIEQLYPEPVVNSILSGGSVLGG